MLVDRNSGLLTTRAEGQAAVRGTEAGGKSQVFY
ncbi:hypothetical protein [Halalkalibacterium ligniniphilum]